MQGPSLGATAIAKLQGTELAMCNVQVLAQVVEHKGALYHRLSRFVQEGAEDAKGVQKVNGRQPPRYMPFTQGPRDCVGQTLARLNLSTTLAQLFGSFSFRLAEEVRSHSSDRMERLAPYPSVQDITPATRPSTPYTMMLHVECYPQGVQDAVQALTRPRLDQIWGADRSRRIKCHK